MNNHNNNYILCGNEFSHYNKNNSTARTSNSTIKNVVSNNSTLLKKRDNSINKYNINDNDAALIPKRHISKNTDIFWDTATS